MSPGDPTSPHARACELVLRYWRLAGLGRGGRRIRIVGTEDHGTHWLITSEVSSLEDPARDVLQVDIVAEKGTGILYSFPTRPRQPVDAGDIESVRRGCDRITPAGLDAMESEAGRRRPCVCCECEAPKVHCDGGRVFLVACVTGDFVRWVHSCPNCGGGVAEWASEPPAASVWHCPHDNCEAERRPYRE